MLSYSVVACSRFVSGAGSPPSGRTPRCAQSATSSSGRRQKKRTTLSSRGLMGPSPPNLRPVLHDSWMATQSRPGLVWAFSPGNPIIRCRRCGRRCVPNMAGSNDESLMRNTGCYALSFSTPPGRFSRTRGLSVRNKIHKAKVSRGFGATSLPRSPAFELCRLDTTQRRKRTQYDQGFM